MVFISNKYTPVFSMSDLYNFNGLWNLLCSSKLNGCLKPILIKIQARFRGRIIRKRLRHDMFLKELIEEMWKPSRLSKNMYYLPDEEKEFYKNMI